MLLGGCATHNNLSMHGLFSALNTISVELTVRFLQPKPPNRFRCPMYYEDLTLLGFRI